MKIALVTYHADPARGGAERYTADLARALTELEHDVSILHAISTPHDVPSVSYLRLQDGGLTRTVKYRNFLRAVDRRLDEEHFDIVHAMLPVHRCNIYQPHAGFAFDALTSGERRRTALARAAAQLGNRFNAKRQIYAAVERKMLEASAPPAVICLSDAMRSQAEARFGLDPANLVVIPNATDLDRYDPAVDPSAGPQLRKKLDIAPARKVGLFLSQDFARKGLSESLEAMGRLGDPSFVLLVAGRDDPSPFQRLAAKLGLTGNVIFAGAAADPYPFYAAADVVLFPSRADPFGLVPAEAVAMGVPPIVSRCAGVSEVLTNNQNALIVEQPSDIGTLADALRRALEPVTHERLARGCRDTREIFAYRKHLDAIVGLYDSRRRSSEAYRTGP
ncbi:MAG: glycosyltransferase family 1 protein [Bradyrhizobiaceae bacterium]|nr:MAG: glycosyltransferase family 1 protein [Bradyrhizobiaceae bacterium]